MVDPKLLHNLIEASGLTMEEIAEQTKLLTARTLCGLAKRKSPLTPHDADTIIAAFKRAWWIADGQRNKWAKSHQRYLGMKRPSLARWRESVGLSQRTVAAAAGLHQPQVCIIEALGRDATDKSYQRLRSGIIAAHDAQVDAWAVAEHDWMEILHEIEKEGETDATTGRE